MSVASALPLGATGDNELLMLRLIEPAEPDEIVTALNRRLPEGLSVTRAEVCAGDYRGPVIRASEFVVAVDLPEPGAVPKLRAAAEALMRQSRIERERTSGGRRRTIDIRPGIESIEVAPGSVDATARITMTLPHRDFTVKPSEIIGALADTIPGIAARQVHRTRLILTTDN
jgi:radical SAM-linked protein